MPKLKLLKKLKMFINKAKRVKLSVQQIKPKLRPSQGADQAKFTPESQTLLHMTQASKGISDVNQTKVDSIKQALEIGEFPINTARVAEKMTSLEKLIQG